MPLLDDVAQRTILLRLESGRGHETDQVIVHPLGGLREWQGRLGPPCVG